MWKYLIFTTCAACLCVLSECGYRRPEESRQKRPVPEWEIFEKEHNFNTADTEIDQGFRAGHGHTGQKSVEECPTFCTMDLSPVCGSNGRTYDNQCLLALDACRTRTRLYVEKAGRC